MPTSTVAARPLDLGIMITELDKAIGLSPLKMTELNLDAIDSMRAIRIGNRKWVMEFYDHDGNLIVESATLPLRTIGLALQRDEL